ncbi:acyl-CoA thioesterase, partial [Amycolatopsis sp. NPDC058986]
MDVYGHVNHANLVTLLEEARGGRRGGGGAPRPGAPQAPKQ